MAPIILFSLITFTVCQSQWELGEPLIPIPLGNVACGVYNDSIFLLGGDGNRNQLMEYMISSNEFIQYGQNALREEVFGTRDFFTQWQNTLYIQLQKKSSSIRVYDLSSSISSFNSTYIIGNDTSIIVGVGTCITASENFVFFLGGYVGGHSAAFNILTLSNNTWSVSAPMNRGKVDSSCIVVSDYLYSIGGGHRTAIEKISIPARDQWEDIDDLTSIVYMAGVVSHYNIIWVIGGFTTDNKPIDLVWNIDVNDDSVVLLDERLPYVTGAGMGATVIALGVLYVFGGVITWSNGESIKNLTKYTLDEPSTTSMFLDGKVQPLTTTNHGRLTTWTNKAYHDRSQMTIVFIVTLVLCVLASCVAIFMYKRGTKRSGDIIHIKPQCDQCNVVAVDEGNVDTAVNGNVLEEKEGDTADGMEKLRKHRMFQISLITEGSKNIDKISHKNALEVQKWLENIVRLPQYYDVLVNNGYESMMIIKEISNEVELFEVGIECEQHQWKILEEIGKWKSENVVEENRKREGSVCKGKTDTSKNVVTREESTTKGNTDQWINKDGKWIRSAESTF